MDLRRGWNESVGKNEWWRGEIFPNVQCSYLAHKQHLVGTTILYCISWTLRSSIPPLLLATSGGTPNKKYDANVATTTGSVHCCRHPT